VSGGLSSVSSEIMATGQILIEMCYDLTVKSLSCFDCWTCVMGSAHTVGYNTSALG
jgi:hypothetical protein